MATISSILRDEPKPRQPARCRRSSGAGENYRPMPFARIPSGGSRAWTDVRVALLEAQEEPVAAPSRRLAWRWTGVARGAAARWSPAYG